MGDIVEGEQMTQVKNTDAKGRITLGGKFANQTVLLEETSDGDILIRPAKVIPQREAWLYENKNALGMVRRGLRQARQRKTVKGPNLKADLKYVESMPDDQE
jgi:hypothetical protein